VRISVGNSSELLELIASDTVELALVGSPAEHPKVLVTPFVEDRLVVIVAPQDAWAARDGVDVEELRERVLLTREPGSALHASVERLLGAAALAGDNVILLGETEAIKRSVEAGLGIALVQGIAVEREVAAGTLRTLPVRGVDTSRTYAYAQRAGRGLSTAARDLIAFLRD
jgi:DNA-binding transcriptional LysR family regulator